MAVSDNGSCVCEGRRRRDGIRRPRELGFYSKWTPKPKQAGDHPNYVLKRSLWPLGTK